MKLAKWQPRIKVADAAVISGSLVIVLFALKLVESVLGLSFRHLGILPRTLAGLPGILFSPLLHSGWNHLTANVVPLFVLLTLLFTNPKYKPLRTLAIIWLGAGLGTWLIGRGDAYHVGASGVNFGLAAFLIAAGWRLKSWRPAVVALAVFLLYGGIFYGVLPQTGPVSWEGHLCGAIAGVLAVIYL
jgi:membrane associated rhomboid family serine protease